MQCKCGLVLIIFIIACVICPALANGEPTVVPTVVPTQIPLPDVFVEPIRPVLKNVVITPNDIQFSILKISVNGIRYFNPDDQAEITRASTSDTGLYFRMIVPKGGRNAIAFGSGNTVTIIRSR